MQFTIAASPAQRSFFRASLPYGKLRKSPVARFANTLTGFYWSIERQEVRNSSTRNILTIEKKSLLYNIILKGLFTLRLRTNHRIQKRMFIMKETVYFYDKCIF